MAATNEELDQRIAQRQVQEGVGTIEPGDLLKLHLAAATGTEIAALLTASQLEEVVYQAGERAEQHHYQDIEHGMKMGWGWEVARSVTLSQRCRDGQLAIRLGLKD